MCIRDSSYIYARYGLINQETYKLDIDFTGIDPNEMTFEFTVGEMLHYWRTAVHTLDAVSYTHLDVYKRQSRRRVSVCCPTASATMSTRWSTP